MKSKKIKKCTVNKWKTNEQMNCGKSLQKKERKIKMKRMMRKKNER